MALDNLGEIMDALAAACTEATNPFTSRAQAWPAESVQPPMIVVGYPESIDFDVTFGKANARGADKATVPLFFVLGNVTARTTRDALSALLADATGIKALIESANYNGKLQTVRVTDCRPESIKIAGVDYLAGRFDCEVIA